MAKVTEKSLKTRCTELNLGSLKSTTFGIRATRTSKGYTVELQYRDATPPQVRVKSQTAQNRPYKLFLERPARRCPLAPLGGCDRR